ncbi:MAG: SagB/ThcOx family dehydrogenase [Candidatus Delongbacteria bacterium]|nr:SagB/ThcOx family dehydrogenase [Candidatus Delongbacteria bacterium]
MIRTTQKIVLIILLIASFIVIGIMLCFSNTKNNNMKNEGNMIELPAPKTSGGISVETAIKQRRSVREYTGNPPGIKELSNAGLRQNSIKEAPAVIVITAVVGRTVSRYPTQGERYIFMEAGHAAQNMYLQCESLGLGMVVIGAFGENDVKNVLKLPEKEKPLYIIPFGNTE